MADLKFAASDEVLALLERHKARTGFWGQGLVAEAMEQVDPVLPQLSRSPGDDELRPWVADAAARDGADLHSVICHVMKRSRGLANPARVSELAREALGVRTTVLIPRRGTPVEMVISGGQTGGDRAGLDAALAVGLPISGYCPKGRQAEDGPIPERFELIETATADYSERTSLNVKHSVATLIVSFDEVNEDDKSGTGKTIRLCRRHDRPLLLIGLHPVHAPSERSVARVVGFLRRHQVRVVNVAGPRESRQPGLYASALAFLTRVLGQEPPSVDRDVKPPNVLHREEGEPAFPRPAEQDHEHDCPCCADNCDVCNPEQP